MTQGAESVSGHSLDFAAIHAAALGSSRARFRHIDDAHYQDAAQHGCEQVWLRAGRLSQRHAENYAVVCAYHHVLCELRRHAARRADLDDQIVANDRTDARIEARERLAAIHALPHRQRTAAVARLLGLTYEQTCEATGHTFTWVNKHTSRARALLGVAA